MVTRITERDSFRAEKPRLGSNVHFLSRPGWKSFSFTLHPDGERFALSADRGSRRPEDRQHVTLIFNFFDELRRMARTATP